MIDDVGDTCDSRTLFCNFSVFAAIGFLCLDRQRQFPFIDGLADLNDFGERMYVREIDREAWGKLIYMRKLSDEEVWNWELAPGKEFDLNEI